MNCNDLRSKNAEFPTLIRLLGMVIFDRTEQPWFSDTFDAVLTVISVTSSGANSSSIP